MNNIASKNDFVIDIRKAKETDLSSVLELNHHLHESEPILEMSEYVRSVWQEMLSDSRLYCFVAESSQQLVGCCTLDIVPNLTRSIRPFGVLQNVVTHKEFRGRGIGRQLNTHVLDFAWSKNCYQVLVQTGRPEVTHFYESLGFKQEKIGLVAKPS